MNVDSTGLGATASWRSEEPIPLWLIAFVAAALAALDFGINGRWGIVLSDEGMIYYGVLRTRAGEIPMADFQSYDPYRYYLLAAWSYLFGDSLYAFRAGQAAASAAGLFFGMLIGRRYVSQPAYLILLAATLLACYGPRYGKEFDVSVSIVAVWGTVVAIETKRCRTLLLVGVLIGVIAGFGRNHGLYATLGTSAAILVSRASQSPRLAIRDLLILWAGIAIGYLPIIAHMVFVPDFFAMLYENSVARWLATGGTNLTLPVPWPWRLDLDNLPSPSDTLAALGYVAVPALYLVLIIRAWHGRHSTGAAAAVILAGLCIGLPYLHHAFSRAAYDHLTQSMHPLILAGSAAIHIMTRERLREILRWAGVGSVVILNVSAWPRIAVMMDADKRYEPVRINGPAVMAKPVQARTVRSVRAFVGKHVKSGEGLMIAGDLPMLYADLRRRSPVWESYHIWPRPDWMQRRMIAGMNSRNVNWILLRDRSRVYRIRPFPELVPLFWRHVRTGFVEVRGHGLPNPIRVFRRKPDGSTTSEPGR